MESTAMNIKPETYFAALESWYRNKHGWKIERQHIEPCPSILNAIAILINQHPMRRWGYSAATCVL